MDVNKLLAQVKSKQTAMARRDRTVKCKDGKNRVRVLPGWRPAEPEQFWHDFGSHFVKNEAGEVQAVYICTEKTFGRPCEVCASLGKAIKAAGDDDMIKLLTEAKASGRILVNALMLDTPEAGKPQILELPPSAFGAILGLFDEYGNVLDPAVGRDLIITREGRGIGTKYTVMPAAKESAVPASALKELHNLDEYVAQENVEQRNRAIAAVASVSGLLPAPAARPAAPALPRGDVPATPAEAIVAAPATRAVNPPIDATATDVSLNEDIDALLAN